jgi:hypothetical protein
MKDAAKKIKKAAAYMESASDKERRGLYGNASDAPTFDTRTEERP